MTTPPSPATAASFTDDNPKLKLAWEFVEYTGRHLFLTGKAGTGKTTFLHHLKDKTAKRAIVTAPTGVAAINAGGVTLHSFFQLPFGPCIPGAVQDDQGRRRAFRFSRDKKEIIRNLDLLIIDEISMVRADVLDAVDEVLRRHRQTSLPFGGVQLLMIGDLHQLSPVAKPNEWRLLQEFYPSVYFFSSHALNRTEWLTIELTRIYRQSDPRFIDILNQVRDNRLSEAGRDTLNQRRWVEGGPCLREGAITLTTHNNAADLQNQRRMDALPGKEYVFKAEISGDFPEYSYPAPALLALKKDAQVMFLRNDTNPEKRYFNGKIGRVASLSGDGVRIRCPGEAADIEVEMAEWENIAYRVDPDTGDIVSEVLGRFKQFPLKPAWAITIHKSQGLTFENAVIDVQAAFAHGQVYVALSRCKTLEGVVLSAPIPARGIETDAAVLAFGEAARQNPPDEGLLEAAKQRYQQELLLSCFDLQSLRGRFYRLGRVLREAGGRARASGASVPDFLQQTANGEVFQVSEKFQHQLKSLFERGLAPEADPVVQERTIKASAWFQEQLNALYRNCICPLKIETDNKEAAKQAEQALDWLKAEMAARMAGIRSCKHGFNGARYLRAISSPGTALPPDSSRPVPGDGEKTGKSKKSGKPPKDSPIDTRRVSMDLFDKGLSVEAVAAERGLAVSTIYGHLCRFVENGALSVNRLLTPEKQAMIAAAVEKAPDLSLKTIKTLLEETQASQDIAYHEIKLMLAHRQALSQTPSQPANPDA